MTKYIEVSGKTEESAIEAALEQLGMSRDDVSVEIVERAKSGFLGLKNSQAVVRVIYEVEGEEEEIVTKAESVVEQTKSAKETAPKEQAKPVAVEPGTSRAVRVESFLAGLLERMEVSAGMEIIDEGDTISVNFSAKDPGVLIGRRGETLDAMQHLTNYSINRGASDRVRINLDAENYRQRRNETLEALAQKVAAKVVKYRRNITLDPMNAYERHVIHTALQEYENITTYSVGNEPQRRIVVAVDRRNNENGRRPENNREWS